MKTELFYYVAWAICGFFTMRYFARVELRYKEPLTNGETHHPVVQSWGDVVVVLFLTAVWPVIWFVIALDRATAHREPKPRPRYFDRINAFIRGRV